MTLPELPTKAGELADEREALAAELLDLCIDWDGTPMHDAAEPRSFPPCGLLRRAAAALRASPVSREAVLEEAARVCDARAAEWGDRWKVQNAGGKIFDYDNGRLAGFSDGAATVAREIRALSPPAFIAESARNTSEAGEREALVEAREALALCADVPLADPYIIVELRALCERAGYGNVMSSASALWRQRLGDQAGGEFVSGPCRATVEKALAKIDAALTSTTEPQDSLQNQAESAMKGGPDDASTSPGPDHKSLVGDDHG